MEWTADGIILAARPFGEADALLELFTRDHGRHAGLVHGGASSKKRSHLQPGTLVKVTWRARLAEQLGHFYPIETLDAGAAASLGDRLSLSAVTAALSMVRTATPEHQQYPALYDVLRLILQATTQPDVWPALFVRWEAGLLAELGYGLDLSTCAATGQRDNLVYVSPRSGRAVSEAAGAPYHDKMLKLPAFLRDSSAPVGPGDVGAGFALTGFFLDRRLFAVSHKALPEARSRMIELLGAAGRL
ncbi:MAG: DNA repair protein RecO [Caulobacterales bacterium]